jgi:hypothetical protein
MPASKVPPPEMNTTRIYYRVSIIRRVKPVSQVRSTVATSSKSMFRGLTYEL